MTTIRETAQNYEPPKTKNVADLKQVSVDIDINTKIVNEGQEGEFAYKFFVHDNEEYRVPITVLIQLKEQLAAKPTMKNFKVSKKGEGKNTKYTVIPL